MSRARRRALLAAIVLAGLIAALVYAHVPRGAPVPPPPGQRPTLLLLTGLPILFPDNFSLDAPASPVLQALDKHYHVVPISVTDPSELAKGALLLMAQPFAQPAEDLVALDAWVRDGGHLLLLADPMLEWPSDKPLEDAARPPAMFADTGLLAHWGLQLDSPDQSGIAARQLGGNRIAAVSPGLLTGRCAIANDRIVAHCRIGAGQATIVADSDFLNVGDIPHSERNLAALLRELGQLDPNDSKDDSDYTQSYPQGMESGTSAEHAPRQPTESPRNPPLSMKTHEKPSKPIVSRVSMSYQHRL